MNTQQTQEVANLEIIEDFIEDSRESFDEMESILVKFENDEMDEELLSNIVLRIHSISTVLRIGGFINASDFGQTILTTLENVLSGAFEFGEKINDIIILSIDKLRLVTEEIFTGGEYDNEGVAPIKQSLEKLNLSSNEEFHEWADEALEKLQNKAPKLAPGTGNTQTTETNIEVIDEHEYEQEEPSVYSEEHDTDLSFFKDIMIKIEACHENWEGRGDNILRLCSAMNRVASKPVDPVQLEAAVYMHDFGMALMPSAPLFNDGLLENDERKDMQEHPLLGYELLHRLRVWEDAAVIVIQHHEWENGKGYPEGISGDSMCTGAKMLAIADTVVAMISKQSYRDYKRPLIRAIAEINACNGVQFSEYWVDVFNQVMRDQKSVILS